MKRILSIMLAMVMALGMTPMMAFAGDEDSGFAGGAVQEPAVEAAVEETAGGESGLEAPAAEAGAAAEKDLAAKVEAAAEDESDADGPGATDAEDPAVGTTEEPLIDEFDFDDEGRELFISYDEAEPDPEDLHYKDGVLTSSFRLESGLVYYFSLSSYDSNWDELEFESRISVNGTEIASSSGEGFDHAWSSQALGQAGDIVTVNVKDITDKEACLIVNVYKYKPVTVSSFPKSLSVTKNKTKSDVDPTEPADESTNYYLADYSINDESVADLIVTYDEHRVELNVKGKQTGTAVITATLPNGKQYHCNLKVTAGLLYTSKTLYLKESFKNAIDGYSGKVTWSSSNKKIATVSSTGVIKGIKKGKATITAKAGGNTFKCTVTVKNPAMSRSSIRPIVGQKYTLSVRGGSGKITWSSSKKSVASVSSAGVVTAKKTGTATITAKRNGFSTTCKVTVVKGLSLSKSSADLIIGADDEGEEIMLTAKGGFGDVTWSSDNEEVASVWPDDDASYEGWITAEGVGTTTIWAERDGYTASCKVTVTSHDNVVYFDPILDDGDPYDVYYHENDWYVKIRPEYTGYMKVTCNEGTGAVRLENKYGEVLSEDIYLAEDDPYAYLGVKNSTYYYLVFTECANFYNYTPAEDEYDLYPDGVYDEDGLKNVTIENIQVSNKCGYSKAGAKTLKKKTTIKGVVYGGDTRAHWYKFKLTKPAYIHMKYNTKIHQASYITIYQGKKIARGGGPHWFDYDEIESFWTDKKMPAGTYYIRIKPDTDYAGTGWYTIKWW